MLKIRDGWLSPAAMDALAEYQRDVDARGTYRERVSRAKTRFSRYNRKTNPAFAAVRAKLADWYCKRSGLKYTGYRALSALSRGETPGPENSIGKLVAAPMAQDMASFAMDLMEMSGALWDGDYTDPSGSFPLSYMAIPGMRIAGGTDEIMANIIAERVLGMPQEPRLDKGIPFNEVPTGAN